MDTLIDWFIDPRSRQGFHARSQYLDIYTAPPGNGPDMGLDRGAGYEETDHAASGLPMI